MFLVLCFGGASASPRHSSFVNMNTQMPLWLLIGSLTGDAHSHCSAVLEHSISIFC